MNSIYHPVLSMGSTNAPQCYNVISRKLIRGNVKYFGEKKKTIISNFNIHKKPIKMQSRDSCAS